LKAIIWRLGTAPGSPAEITGVDLARQRMEGVPTCRRAFFVSTAIERFSGT